uniref:Uncharacterized protein n=1 Tax=Solanum tuberosum TaxID=4113 RepID=M1BWX1_SOLTU
MANIRASKKMNEKKKVPQRGLGIAQLERIRLEEQHHQEFIPTSSRIDFSSKDCVFTPNQTAPFLENCSKLWSGEYSQGVNQKVDHHAVVVCGKNLNSPSVLQQRCQQYQKTSSTSIMAGVKRPYLFEIVSKSRALSESKPSISMRETKALNGDFLSLAPPAAASPHLEAVTQCSLINSAQKCLQLFDYVPSRVAAAEHTPPSGLSISVQQPILGLFPSAKAHIDREGTRGNGWREEVLSVLFRIPTCPFISMQNVLCCPCIQITRNCLQQQRVLSQCTPPSGLSISVQQPILGFFPSAKVQIGREGTHGSDDLHTEVGGNVDLELKL